MASLNFKGKNIIWNHHMSVPYHTLDLDEKLSYKQDEADGNLIIEGDNLPVLKSLLPQYTGKIDCIYIDPPYNTGKERWVYNDNVNSPLINDWIGKTVDKEDLTRHDKWLCMMVPRLKLMREFLSNEGAIFVSIDENELHHLINILNEIFGEQCYITTFIWNKKNGRQNDANYVSTNHEYIVCYCMNKEKYRMKKFPRKEVNNKEFSNPDNDSRGVWIHRPLHAKSGSVDSLYEVEFPNGVKWSVPKGTYPRFKKEDLLRMFNENKLWFGKTGKNVPRYKRFLTDVSKGIISNTILKADEVGSTQLSRQELQSLGLEEEFENTKPYQLISYLLTLSSNKESIILDAFAGSGTTAQAVLELNEEDKGNRKFILIQMPENTEKEPKKNIARYITRERVVKVIEKKLKNKDVGFEYRRVGQPIDAETILSGQLPTYKQLAKYVFYLATGQSPKEKEIDEKKYLAGKVDHTEVYLLYTPDMEELKKMAITFEWAKEKSKGGNKKKIVYAPACFMDDEYLEQFNMKFVSIPYNLFEREK